MLQSIRDRATGPTAWFIVGLITIPFAFWGIDSYVSGPTNPDVAEVGSVDISRVQLQRAYDQSYQRLQQLMGENFKPDDIDTAQLRRGVLENLVQESLLKQHASKAGYRVSDVQIIQNLQDQPAFQVDGSFSPQRYREVLSRSGYTAASYEQLLRESLAVEQLQAGLTNTAFITHKDVDAALRRQKQRRQVSYLMFSHAKYLGEAEITEADIKARYEMDADKYRTPEKLKLAYVELDKSKLPEAAKPEEEVLKAIYDAEKQARFTRQEKRQASHILVQVDEDTDEDAAQQKVQALKERLDNGENFSELAKEASDDIGSADKGGDLGWISKGVMVPEFEEALFSLEQDVVSEPVRSPFGWHLIRVDAVEAGEVQSFEDPEVQEKLLETYRNRELEKRYEQLAKKLDELSFDYPDSLEQAAEALDAKVKTTGWITREGGEGLASQPAVLEAAFSPAVIENRENSAPIQLAGDRQVVVRVQEYQAAEQRPLEAVADEIRKALKQEYASQQADADAAEALKVLQAGKSLNEAATQTPAQLKTAGWLMRDANQPDAAIVSQAFQLPRPQEDQPEYGTVNTGDGVAVVALLDVKDGDPSSASEEERENLRRNLMAAQAQSEFGSYMSDVRDDISVEIHEDQL
ncbi:MAG: SurA N-terminal domain-containing protein [Salinisphaeraceae bacterium]|nr:SurA N-terminal domain-containing protein [Salinisphaeraceae bacterium]